MSGIWALRGGPGFREDGVKFLVPALVVRQNGIAALQLET